MRPSNATVLITRPEPGASETAARVATLGLTPILSPVLSIQPTTANLPSPSAIAAVLATSGNAVDALSPDWHTTRLLTVGDATAARARAAGFRDVVSAAGNAEALAALVGRKLVPDAGSLLLASGLRQGQPLAIALRHSGYRVIRRVLYVARPVPDLAPAAIAALHAGNVRAALFFSADTAQRFVRLVRRAGLASGLAGVEAISISRSAAVALGALSWRDIRVAARPNQDEMLALLQ
ncbi:MAG TPA: uroporphyrinogen-III synthase [Acetobacteraceae bacterium]|nr:uroporphyrinogen-III synthase [Acetobacteraceae bacterium]